MTSRRRASRIDAKFLILGTFLVLLLVSGIGCSSKRGEGDSCAKPEDCDVGLTCSPDPSAPMDPSSAKCFSPETLKKAFDDAMKNLGR